MTSASFQTPKGRVDQDATDPPGFSIVGVRTREPFAKDRFVKRRAQEIEIGELVAREIMSFRPEVVICSNVPLDTLAKVQPVVKRTGASFIFWVQDLYGEAIGRILRKRLGLLASLVGMVYNRLEARLLRRSDHCIVITEDFVPVVQKLAGLETGRITVIENWAPLDELPVHERDNSWAQANLPAAPFRLIYSGTLGAKHNPDLLYRLAAETGAQVCVFSEGPTPELLRQRAKAAGLDNLKVSGWVPFQVLPDLLAGGDALIVILEPDAGIFSVPSKVLTYMCAGKPILGAMPRQNLAARLIEENGAGCVVDPGDVEGFVAAARRLSADASLRVRQGNAARAYAERTFDIDRITDKFEQVFETLANQSRN